jgi:PBSX family phage terminase large subunit
MKLQPLSKKQRDFLLHSDARINIAYGSVRSGKTLVSLLRWLYIVATAPEGSGLLMIGKTERTLRRNILDLIAELVEPKDYKLNSGMGECYLYGKKIYLVGANDERAENKIRGITLYAAYLDEATLCPESFFRMLLSRLSSENAILLATTNPDSPAHYIKKNFIDRAGDLNLKSWHFVLDDNKTLPRSYVDEISKEYTGLWYQRYILGNFVMAEGAIYPDYQASVVPADDLPKSFDTYIVTCDYGTTNAFVYLLVGRLNGVWYIIREFYYDSSKSGIRVNKQQSDELSKFLAGILPASVEVDPSAPAFIQQLRQDYPALDRTGSVVHAINAVLVGIQQTAQMMYQGKLKISDSCTNTLKEMAGYTWDPKATENGEDAPVKVNDHAMDCLRYAVNRIAWDYS